MRVCVINGSPKGESSISLQTVLYLQGCFSENTFEIIEAGQRLRAFENSMDEAAAILSRADLILFCYPVYTFLVPYQLHRFIELMRDCAAELSGKPFTQISTSKHFYDTTAHRFIEENCADMGLCCIKGLSADMEDLLSEKGRRQAEDFWRFVEFSLRRGIFEKPALAGRGSVPEYWVSLESIDKKEGYDTVIVTNVGKNDDNLLAMIEDFERFYPYPVRLVNIAEFPFDGGCIGCFKCAVTGKCAYKDGFDEFLRTQIQTADAVVYAFSIENHSMGASFKRFDDRQFCNGHRTVTMGRPVGHLIFGDYEGEQNLKTVIEARSQVGQNFFAGAATDAASVRAMSQKLCYALENGYAPPQNFYGVGGMKIFRDLIYVMRGMMRADHEFYKKHGLYDDLPQRQWKTILKMQLVGFVLKNPKVQAKLGNKMTEAMLEPYKRVIKDSVKN